VKVVYRESFKRDIKKIKEKKLLKKIKDRLTKINECNRPEEIVDLKKLSGEFGFYRVRIGDFRLGLYIKDDVVEVVRFLHRKDIYKFFP
jgi:mRNA interferase RelE/StbE